VHGACTALRHATSVFCASESNHIPKHPQQWHLAIHIEIVFFFIDSQFDHGH
jgi:hypothetical protein